MVIAMLYYLAAVIFTLVLGTFLLYKIEQSGVERWGATGHLFRYRQRDDHGQPDDNKLADDNPKE